MTKNILFTLLILLTLTQLSFGQKGIAPAKNKLADQLTSNSIGLFPIEYFETTFKSATTGSLGEIEEALAKPLYELLDKQSDLSEDKKVVLRARIADFSNKLSERMRKIASERFKIREAATKSLKNRYINNFTMTELQKLDKFFKTTDGQDMILLFNQSITKGIEDSNSEPDEATQKAFGKMAFAVNEKIFTKFGENVLKGVMADIDAYAGSWSREIVKTFEKEMDSGEMKREMEKFLSDNFNLPPK